MPTDLCRFSLQFQPQQRDVQFGWSEFHSQNLSAPVPLSKSTWCVTSAETMRLIRNGEKGGRGYGGGGRGEIIYLSLHCHHQNDFCIKVGSDESHFNVPVGSDGQSHKTVSTNHNLFEEKGEPKRYRTEVLPLTSLTPYR